MRAIASAGATPRASRRAEVLDAGGDGGAELLGVGRPGVVEAGAVDGHDAQAGAIGAEPRRSTRRRRRGARRGRRAAGSAAAMPSGSAPSDPDVQAVADRVGGVRPAGAGIEDDPGEVEQHAVERAGHAWPRRGRRRRRGRAAPTWRPSPAPSTARSDPAAASTRWRTSQPSWRVPPRRAAADERGEPREPGGVGRRARRRPCTAARSSMPSYVVERSRVDRRVGRQRALAVEGLGDGRGPLVVIGGRELAGEHEIGRRAPVGMVPG